jgi:radical SAM superfamily enzyme YgiQ (UPF0313 family)
MGKLKIADDFNLFAEMEPRLEGVKVLLVYPPVRLSAQPLFPPFGMLSIGSVLEKAGATVEILDLNMERLTYEELKADIAGREFDIVGTGGMATVYYYMKFLAEFFRREYPDVPLIGGGTACSGSPDVVVKHTKLDAIVMGEGEPVIIRLIDTLLNGGDLSAIPGIAYLDEGGEVVKTDGRSRMSNLEELPFPAYHLIDMEKYISNTDIYKNKVNKVSDARIRELGLDRRKATRPVMLFSKRGCPFQCNFCYRNFGRKVVGMSVQHTLDHMAFLEKEYETINFVFGDEIFNVNKKWVMAFCQQLIDEKRNYILSVGNGLRANVVDEELMKKMKEAGFCSVAVGIESFYSPTLRAMKKGQTKEIITDAIRTIKGCGFRLASAQFLFGYEPDGPESMRANVEACKELGLKNAGFAIPCPYPGTFLYERAIEEGYITDEEGWLMELADRDISDRVINMSSRPDEELVRLIQEGEDEIRMHFLRKENPLVGKVLTPLQKIGRKFDVNAFNTIKAVKDAGKNFIKYRRLPDQLSRSGGASDVHIRDEAFELLDRWAKEAR